MLIENGDGTYTGGPLDAFVILHHIDTGHYHVAFFEERPLPGPLPPPHEVPVVRLAAKMHHTQGAATLADAILQRAELAAQIHLPETNSFDEPVEWDGSLGTIIFRQNWLSLEVSPAF